MIRHILVLVSLLVVCNLGKADNKVENNSIDDHTSSAIRNSLKFNYDLISGNSIAESSDLSDDFNIPTLRSHWEYRLKEGEWTLKDRPGYLRIKAQKISKVEDIRPENTFSQKIKSNIVAEAVTMIDLSGMDDHTCAGIYCRSSVINFIGIQAQNGKRNLTVTVSNNVFTGPEVTENTILLRVKIDVSKAWFEYSFNGIDFTKLGDQFQVTTMTGSEGLIGFYCLNDIDENCSVDIDWFYYNPKVDHTVRYTEIENKILIPEI